MILRPIRNATLIGAAMIALVLSPVPASAQVIVYDPSNYVQNVLQAARALQQINSNRCADATGGGCSVTMPG
jgi:type IV secretion system protein TrbJ